MHQDGPSVSAKTRGRAVAYLKDILTLASHTITGKGQTPVLTTRHHDQPSVTRPSSRRLAPDTGVGLYGTASARDRTAVERLGAVAIDYRTEDFLARVRELTGNGVDVALDGLGGVTSLRSFRALRPGGRLVVYGHYATLAGGRKSWRGWVEWYAMTAGVALWGLLSPRRRVLTYRIQRLRDSRQWLPVAGRRPACRRTSERAHSRTGERAQVRGVLKPC
jgi:NADPH:quinone reductase-like Zn-dependent oxidoreductase